MVAEEIALLRAQAAAGGAAIADTTEREELEQRLREKEEEIATLKERDDRNLAMLKEKREELQRAVEHLEEDEAQIEALKAVCG